MDRFRELTEASAQNEAATSRVPPGAFTLRNSIVAYVASGNNGCGTFIDPGHNLNSDGSINLSAPGSLKSLDPKLGLLNSVGDSRKWGRS